MKAIGSTPLWSSRHSRWSSTRPSPQSFTTTWRRSIANCRQNQSRHRIPKLTRMRKISKFIDRRPYDPEGLYYYGKTLEQLEQRDEAREVFGRCVEAVQTMPSYRCREHRRWDKLAREQLKKPQITQIESV